MLHRHWQLFRSLCTWLSPWKNSSLLKCDGMYSGRRLLAIFTGTSCLHIHGRSDTGEHMPNYMALCPRSYHHDNLKIPPSSLPSKQTCESKQWQEETDQDSIGRRNYLQWRSAPPSSSALMSSPVAAFTSGGPARNTVPVPCTMTLSSAIAGTYAPPAVQLPITTAIYKHTHDLFSASSSRKKPSANTRQHTIRVNSIHKSQDSVLGPSE